MSQSEPPENLMLPLGSLNIVLDALLARRLAGKVSQQMTEVASLVFSAQPPFLTLVRAPKLSSRGAEFSRSPGSDRSVSIVGVVSALRFLQTLKSSEDFGLMGKGPTSPSDDVSRKRLEIPAVGRKIPVSRTEMDSVESVLEAFDEVAPVVEEREHGFAGDRGVAYKVEVGHSAPRAYPASFFKEVLGF